MAQYEQPIAEILRFLPRQAIAREDHARVEKQDEGFEITSTPEITEGVGDW